MEPEVSECREYLHEEGGTAQATSTMAIVPVGHTGMDVH